LEGRDEIVVKGGERQRGWSPGWGKISLGDVLEGKKIWNHSVGDGKTGKSHGHEKKGKKYCPIKGRGRKGHAERRK